jgi:hypothetical protein
MSFFDADAVEARAATAQRNRDEKVKRIHNRLSLKVRAERL